MNYKKKLAVYFRKCGRALQNKIAPSNILSETQLLAMSVVRESINSTDAKLLIAPITGAMYIHCNNIFIKLCDDHVNIINGIYSYHIDLDNKTINHLQQKFNQKLEFTSKQYEGAISDKTKRNLNSILTNNFN